jgi:hypothetical protein
MVHYGEGLTFGFKAADNRLGVHAGFDHLEGNPPSNRFALFGDINDPETTLANLVQHAIAADRITRDRTTSEWARLSGNEVIGEKPVNVVAIIDVCHAPSPQEKALYQIEPAKRERVIARITRTNPCIAEWRIGKSCLCFP